MNILDNHKNVDFYEYLINTWGKDPLITYDRRRDSQEDSVCLSATGLGLGETVKWAQEDVTPAQRELEVLWVGNLKFILVWTKEGYTGTAKRQVVPRGKIDTLNLPYRLRKELEALQKPTPLPRSPCKLLQFNCRHPDHFWLVPYSGLLKDKGVNTVAFAEEIYQELCEALAPKPKEARIPTECLITSKGFTQNSFRNTK